MSYEGFEQWLCRTGHLHIFDCYDTPEQDTWRCPDCGEPLGHWNGVDCTNGRAIGEQKFAVHLLAPTCPCCGQETGPAVYHLPKNARAPTPTHTGSTSQGEDLA